MIKRIVLIAAGVLAVIIAIALSVGSCSVRIYDPNEEIKNKATEVIEGEVYDSEYERGSDLKDVTEGMVTFRFVPVESANYIFTADNIVSDEDVVLDMHVMDESMSELLEADNYGGDEDSKVSFDYMEGSAFLTKGETYYATVEASSRKSFFEEFSGSFRFTVNRSEGDSGPPEIKAGETVTLTVEKDKQVCAVFIPEETAYYDFDPVMVSSDASVGFSSIADITSEDDTSMVITDGICHLEAGKKYFVWVNVNETTRSRSKVELGCSAMSSEGATGEISIGINGNTIIEYTAESDDAIMVSSVSDGDPDASVYDSDGFLISYDDDSGESVSGNAKDFALGMYVENGKTYKICVNGKYEKCTVNIQKYMGDGTSPDSVEPEETGDGAGAVEAPEDAE